MIGTFAQKSAKVEDPARGFVSHRHNGSGAENSEMPDGTTSAILQGKARVVVDARRRGLFCTAMWSRHPKLSPTPRTMNSRR